MCIERDYFSFSFEQKFPLTILSNNKVRWVRSFFVLITFSLSAFSFAQRPLQSQNSGREGMGRPAAGLSPGVIMGTIINSQNQNPVEFATIALFNSNDSIITGTITSSKGTFKLEQVPFGQFRMEATFIGYKTYRKDSIIIKAADTEVNLGKLLLIENTELLNEVEVLGEKRMVEMAIDKKVFNVEKNITSAGGSATDVLQNIPSVSVDIDGNISLRGSGNITVLVDGKPSGLTGSGRSAVLQQIPASSIESIEVITNPSVKYDPDGMSGIINIILKKNRKKGSNGSISAGLGTREKYNASASLNYRSEKLNAYINYSFRYNPINGEGIMMRENFFTDSVWYLNQNTHSQSKPVSHLLKTGFDFFLNDKNTLGISAGIGRKNDPDEQTIEYQNLNSGRILTDLSVRTINETDISGNLDLSADFKHNFKKTKQVLTADLSYSNAKEESTEQFSQQEFYTDYSAKPASPSLQQTFNDRKYEVAILQSDYVHPLKEKSKIEAGYKTTLRQVENIFFFENFRYPSNEWQRDSLRNSQYSFLEQVHAAYGTFSNAFGKLSYQLGLRLEQAYTFSEQPLISSNSRNEYFSYFPGGHLSYQQGKSNEFQFSYSKRINRPSVEALIAVTDFDDPLNLRVGNPDLKPEYIHSFELSYALNLEKHTLTSSVYNRQVVNMIQRFRTVDPSSGIATVRVENYAGATNTGFEFVARNELFRWWSITSNLNLYRSVINASNIESDLHNEGFSWMAKATSNFNFPQGLQVQISGGYRAPTPVTLGTMKAMYGIDAGIKKDVLKGKGSFNLNVSDIFDTRQFAMDIVQPGYHHTFTRKRETRVVTLIFTYKFGKSEGRQKQKGKSEGEMQMRGEEMF